MNTSFMSPYDGLDLVFHSPVSLVEAGPTTFPNVEFGYYMATARKYDLSQIEGYLAWSAHREPEATEKSLVSFALERVALLSHSCAGRHPSAPPQRPSRSPPCLTWLLNLSFF